MKVRFIRHIGTRAALRVYWGDACPGRSGRGYHNAEVHLLDSAVPYDGEVGGRVEDYTDGRWPTACDACAAPVPSDLPVSPPASSYDAEGNRRAVVIRQVFRSKLYDTPSGKPEPGTMFWADWYECDERGGKCVHGWTNCDGRHLFVITPNGQQWDVDSRASNCTLKHDTTHRCWIRTGDPETGVVHVSKAGRTCSAGAGSIVVPGWHGFLHHGVLRPC